jgi:hypothetical protein
LLFPGLIILEVLLDGLFFQKVHFSAESKFKFMSSFLSPGFSIDQRMAAFRLVKVKQSAFSPRLQNSEVSLSLNIFV